MGQGRGSKRMKDECRRRKNQLTAGIESFSSMADHCPISMIHRQRMGESLSSENPHFHKISVMLSISYITKSIDRKPNFV